MVRVRVRLRFRVLTLTLTLALALTLSLTLTLTLMARRPSVSPSSTSPFSVIRAGCTPKKGSVALPGFMRQFAQGSGVIMIPPVSVCHQVSTIGQRPSPTTLKYQRQASGLIGSPTWVRVGVLRVGVFRLGLG